jgi:hypothetical protein
MKNTQKPKPTKKPDTKKNAIFNHTSDDYFERLWGITWY